MTRESVVAEAVDAYVCAFIRKEHAFGKFDPPVNSADEILMRLTPDYNRDPTHTTLYHELYDEVIERSHSVLIDKLRALGRLCRRDGCDTPLNRRQERYCSRECAGVALRDAKTGNPRPNRVQKSEVDRMVELYESGMSIEEVAAATNRSIGSVSRSLKKRNVQLRSRGFRAEIHRYRTCEQCGQRYEKSPNVTWARWLKRQYCGADCYQASRDNRESA